jgi:alanine dehydrogenase
MPVASLPPLRWYDAAAVEAAMPPIAERLALAELTLVALATPGSGELPPKIGIHPRPDGSFVHAMPAHLRGANVASDLVGMKWVAGFGTNNARGLPAIHAVVVLNDPATGVPRAILDGGPITAQRTAAVSGVAIGHWAAARPSPGGGAGGRVVAVIGAGTQGRSHLPVLGHQLPGARIRLYDRHADRASALAAAGREIAGIADVSVHGSAREAVESADVVVTAASFAPAAERQVMTPDWLGPDTLVVAVDYATYVSAAIARDAGAFLTDERGQFLANRDAGSFDGYPDPTDTIGGAILGDLARPPGRMLVSHLGVGLADIVFGDAIVTRADELGLGMELSGRTE